VNDVAYALALGVAAVFAWAGAGKLAAPKRARRAFRRLGVAPSLARVVPVVELALAAAIVVVPVTALAAAALLGAFTVVLARADDGVGCACFGSASTTPISWVHLARNALLIGASLAASTATPDVPALAAVLCATGVAIVGGLGLALADLKHRTGTVLTVDLP
jgi:hypothetical protein